MKARLPLSVGGAGMATAVAAAENGADVILLEKTPYPVVTRRDINFKFIIKGGGSLQYITVILP